MSYCTPCPPCDSEYPLLCEPLETTANGKRLVVEDSAACQKTIQSPLPQQVLKTNGSGNLAWTNGGNGTVLAKSSNGNVEFSTINSVLQSNPIDLGSQPLTTTGIITGSLSGNATTATTATTANTAITATTSESCSGNSNTATKLQTARSINGVAFDGTANITVPATASGANVAKAWVSFNGATTGTNAPTLSYNVTSVTRTAVGLYEINFPTGVFTDANYVVTGICATTTAAPAYYIGINNTAGSRTTTKCFIAVGLFSTNADLNPVTLAFFGN